MAEAADKEFDELDAKVQQLSDAVKAGTISTLESTYVDIIGGVKKASVKCKKLAAVNIPLFFKHFQKQSDAAINGQLDLCEEQDDVTRMTAIKGLPALCEDTPEQTPKIADFLGQLLMTENKAEQRLVHSGLDRLLSRDPKSTLGAMFNLIKTSEDALRERTIKFVREKLTKDSLSTLAKAHEGLEDLIGEQIKEVLRDVDGAEFQNFYAILQQLSKFDVKKGGKEAAEELLKVLVDQADLSKDFDPAEKDTIERLKGTLKLAEPLFNEGASAGNFLEYLMGKVLPKLASVPAEADRVQLLVFLADLGPRASPESAKQALEATYELIKAHLPAKPAAEGEEEPAINFTLGETLLFCLHLFGSKAPETAKTLLGLQKKKPFTGQPADLAPPPEDAVERIKDLEARSAYLALRANNFNKEQSTQWIAEQKKIMEARKAATSPEEKKTVEQSDKSFKERKNKWSQTFDNIKKLNMNIAKKELLDEKQLPKLVHSLRSEAKGGQGGRQGQGQGAGQQQRQQQQAQAQAGTKRAAPAKPAIDPEVVAKRQARFGPVDKPAPAGGPKRKAPEPAAEGAAAEAGAEAAEGDANGAGEAGAKKARGRGMARAHYKPPARRQ
eukprot:tig00020930_g16037.t1